MVNLLAQIGPQEMPDAGRTEEASFTGRLKESSRLSSLVLLWQQAGNGGVNWINGVDTCEPQHSD